MSQFPCAEGHNSLTPDLVGKPLVGVQICTQQTRWPVKNIPLYLLESLASDPCFGSGEGKAKHYIRLNDHKNLRLTLVIDNTCYWVNTRNGVEFPMTANYRVSLIETWALYRGTLKFSQEPQDRDPV